MVTFLRFLLPLLILGATGSVAWWWIKNRPEPKERVIPPTITSVEATRLKLQDYPIALETRGIVRPRTETILLPEVSGMITKITPRFREGAFFEEGDPLLEIDPLNYETAVAIAESNVAQAVTAVAEEKIRGQQRLDDWKRIGKTGQPSDMVLRKPQLAEMEARLRAAEAELEKAERDLQRTVIKAPYVGRVLVQNVDVGQYVSTGTQLAEIFAVDVAEIRLPLTSKQLDFVDLPEAYRGEETAQDGPDAYLRAEVGGKQVTWKGKVVRVEGAIDDRSRQLFVVAQVEDPYEHTADDRPPLKVGLYTDAIVQGKVIEDVFVIQRDAVRAGGEVIVIEEDNTIRRQPVTPFWSDRDFVVIRPEEGGLQVGDVVCTTPLAYPANGARVSPIIDGKAPTTELGGRPGGGPGQKPGGKGKKGDRSKGGAPPGGAAARTPEAKPQT